MRRSGAVVLFLCHSAWLRSPVAVGKDALHSSQNHALRVGCEGMSSDGSRPPSATLMAARCSSSSYGTAPSIVAAMLRITAFGTSFC